MRLHSPGLAGWLAAATATLVTLAVAAVSFYGVETLRRLAEQEGLTRVALAASAAREGVRQSTEDLLTAAHVLADRPTLHRLLSARDESELAPYLEQYCSAASLDACAVVRGDRPLATAGKPVAWDAVLAAAAEQGARFMTSGAMPGVALGGAKADVPDGAAVGAVGAGDIAGGATVGAGDVAGGRAAAEVSEHPAPAMAAGAARDAVVIVRAMDTAFEKRLGERAGLTIRVVDYAGFRPGEGPFGVLNSDALSRGDPAAGYVEALGIYAASVPVRAPSGRLVALLHAILPAAEVMDPVDTLARRILVVAIFVAALATTSGILIGRHWIAGVHRLTRAARRLASGDLATSIPAQGGRELTVLGATMEEMRRNLVDLTTELRRREAEAQAVLGGIVEGVYAVDEARRVRFLNPQAERLLKVPAGEALGRFCGDVLRPKPDAAGRRPCEHACPILRARRAGAADAVEQIEPEPGRVRRVVISSASPSDRVQVQVLRDETELEAVRRTRDSVLANISHEFRTPLAAQLASIELLADGIGRLKPAEQRELVRSLQRGAHRLTWLIDNLLESVRVESDQLAIRRRPVSLAAVVDEARELVEPLLEQRGQKLEAEGLAALPPIQGDAQRLVQVLVNLLGNANKYAPANSTIRIGGAAEHCRVTIWVEDEGPGPSASEGASLFERFRRAGEQEPQESGLGLGLFIVRSIVERHGGRVRLFRSGEGRTRAEVELPRETGP
ncbi:MAG TPA: ATP-binding protein [Gammaproteobacteria bacterium]|nr:ATP-binding protein [Gammaproteobacteria bacterium]